MEIYGIYKKQKPNRLVKRILKLCIFLLWICVYTVLRDTMTGCTDRFFFFVHPPNLFKGHRYILGNH